MIRRPPRSTPLYSSAASDVYKRQVIRGSFLYAHSLLEPNLQFPQKKSYGAESIQSKRCYKGNFFVAPLFFTSVRSCVGLSTSAIMLRLCNRLRYLSTLKKLDM